MTTKPIKFVNKLSLGGISAEADEFIRDAFYDTSDFSTIKSKSNKKCFIIGRTGSGKSAVLSRIELINKEDVIRINPENLAFPYITNLDIIRRSKELNVNLDLFWSGLWKHVLLVEIIRHRYRVNSTDAKSNIFQGLLQKIRNDPTKKKALEYLEEYQDRFWEDTDVRIRAVTEGFKSRIEESAKLRNRVYSLSGDLKGSESKEPPKETISEEAQRYQLVVNENQLPKINAMIEELNDEILHDEQNFTYIIIDDLDLYWVDETIVTDLIRVLFKVVFELKKVLNLKILVALRTNMFQELDFGKLMGGQEEKFRGLVVDMKWNFKDLVLMLDERAKVVTAKTVNPVKTFSQLLPVANSKRGNPLEYILERTMFRPRDAITFANACFDIGAGKPKLSWEDIKRAEENYSRDMILALRDEWKLTYPGIDQVVEKFRSTPMRMSPSQISEVLLEIGLLPSTPDFVGTRWLEILTSRIWQTPKSNDDFFQYKAILEMLFSIGLIGCSTNSSDAPVFYYDDSQFITRKSTFDKIKYFYVHKTYQIGLEIRPKSELS